MGSKKQFSYLAERNRWREFLMMNDLLTTDIALMNCLYDVNNMCNWKEWFNVPTKVIKQLTGISSRKTIIDSRKRLQKHGLIEVKEGVRNIKAAEYRINFLSFHVQPLYMPSNMNGNMPSNMNGNMPSNMNGNCTKTNTNTNTKTNTNKDIVGQPDDPACKNSESKKECQQKETYLDERKEVIDYLNKKAGTKYQHNSAHAKRLIPARLNEGYSVDDIKLVIDIKIKEWGNDNKMRQYIRPETLFSNKFEGYYNQGLIIGGKNGKGLDEDYSHYPTGDGSEAEGAI